MRHRLRKGGRAALQIALVLAPWIGLAAWHAPAGASGLPRKSMIGLGVAPIPADSAARYRLPDSTGMLVTAVVPKSPAFKARFETGDLILTQDGAPAIFAGFPGRIAAMPAGRTLHFQVMRAGKKREIEVNVAPRPFDPGTAVFRVDYGEVLSQGRRLRILVSHPRAAGRHPALFYLPGLTASSVDYILMTSADTDARILYEMANAGFVTLRVDKPGSGDSEGGPYASLDFQTEADAYRQGLLALRQMPDVDTTRIFLFGHSMGGAYAPLLASEIPVRGIAVYGTVARTWHEYLLDVERHQGPLDGESLPEVDDRVRKLARLLELALDERQSPEQIRAAHPDLDSLVTEQFPNGLYFGRTLEFWRQLEATNFAALWARCGAHVLAVHGESDYVSYVADHELIARIVEDAHPGWGKYVSLPSSDHWLYDWPSEVESKRHAGTGKYNPAFAKLLRDWIGEVGKLALFQ